jgi:hypothetical protein
MQSRQFKDALRSFSKLSPSVYSSLKRITVSLQRLLSTKFQTTEKYSQRAHKSNTDYSHLDQSWRQALRRVDVMRTQALDVWEEREVECLHLLLASAARSSVVNRIRSCRDSPKLRYAALSCCQRSPSGPSTTNKIKNERSGTLDIVLLQWTETPPSSNSRICIKECCGTI